MLVDSSPSVHDLCLAGQNIDNLKIFKIAMYSRTKRGLKNVLRCILYEYMWYSIPVVRSTPVQGPKTNDVSESNERLWDSIFLTVVTYYIWKTRIIVL